MGLIPHSIYSWRTDFRKEIVYYEIKLALSRYAKLILDTGKQVKTKLYKMSDCLPSKQTRNTIIGWRKTSLVTNQYDFVWPRLVLETHSPLYQEANKVWVFSYLMDVHWILGFKNRLLSWSLGESNLFSKNYLGCTIWDVKIFAEYHF